MEYIYIYIYICWFNFDARAQGNAYKPTKEPINYREPGGFQWHARGCTGQLTTRLACTVVNFNTHVCVNFELRPGAGDIHICWFNFDALVQGNAYEPTKERINQRGPGGDRPHDLQTEATPPAASCLARSLHATEIVRVSLCALILYVYHMQIILRLQ